LLCYSKLRFVKRKLGYSNKYFSLPATICFIMHFAGNYVQSIIRAVNYNW